MLIDVTDHDLRKMLQAAFDQSRPQGLGFLRHTPEPLTDEEFDELLADGDEGRPISADYVRGRSMKFHVMRVDGRLFVEDDWYDHTKEQLGAVLAASAPA